MLAKIKLNPLQSPFDYHAISQNPGPIPDGTGLQLLFKIEEEYYVLAGPRGKKLLPRNGGRIEDNKQSFFKQLKEEVEEETFDIINISENNGQYQLIIKMDDKVDSHSLKLLEDKTFITSTDKYAYVTFTAICDSINLETLNKLADKLSPTALFWNEIGNYLFKHVLEAKKANVSFPEYWQTHAKECNNLIAGWREKAEKLLEEKLLILSPQAVFGKDLGDTLDEAFNCLNKIENYEQLRTMFNHTIGRYSERSGYYVIKAQELLAVIQNQSKLVKDIRGKIVADEGVFDESAVREIYPTLINAPKTSSATLLAQVGSFPVSRELSSSGTQNKIEGPTLS